MFYSFTSFAVQNSSHMKVKLDTQANEKATKRIVNNRHKGQHFETDIQATHSQLTANMPLF